MERKPRKGDNNEPESVKKSIKGSIEDLSNMVFGLALSLGTLTFITNVTTNIALIESRVVVFGFSFIILIYLWLKYTDILEILKVETRFEIILNIALLFMVVIEPYFFNLLHTSLLSPSPDQLQNFTSTLFGLDIASMMLILGFLYSYGIKSYGRLQKRRVSAGKYSLLVMGVAFAISSIPNVWDVIVYGVQLRFIIWVLSFFLAISVWEVIRVKARV